jgi:predicted amidophosphoribosyltransferase
MSEKDYGMCGICGYKFRAVEEVCPECGNSGLIVFPSEPEQKRINEKKRNIPLTINLPEDLVIKMKHRPNTPWDKVIARGIERFLEAEKILEQLEEPEITEEEAIRRVLETRKRERNK